ncbi:uncharacterized protein VTP21DRAFT_407 [Calcarisporiella thermophila]|uniref:uncharacterized protein n=1 Tax=Calcarisporiella thermophila TaxID=911321 RepID=UPI003743889C
MSSSLHPPYHLAVIADPQITDEYSYDRKGLLLEITKFYSDMYMRRNFRHLSRRKKPDAVIFLGDLMDGGREIKKQEDYAKELHRFRHLFRPVSSPSPRYYFMAGNHDIGFGDSIVPLAVQRYRASFGELNYEIQLANHSIVVLDTLSLSSQKANIRREAAALLERVGRESSIPPQPRILFTHVPLYRPSGSYCGPERSHIGSIENGSGYQYQNLIDQTLSQRILATLQPSLVLSGDDHDYCEVQHSWKDHGAKEITVSSFSMTMGVKIPGYVLLSLHDPTLFSSSVGHAFCPLPNQIEIFLTYALALLINLVVLAVFRRKTEKYIPLHHNELDDGAKNKWQFVRKRIWKRIGNDVVQIGWVALSVYVGCLVISFL